MVLFAVEFDREPELRDRDVEVEALTLDVDRVVALPAGHPGGAQEPMGLALQFRPRLVARVRDQLPPQAVASPVRRELEGSPQAWEGDRTASERLVDHPCTEFRDEVEDGQLRGGERDPGASDEQFTPETPNGEVLLEFVVPADSQSKTMVAFERVYHGDVEVAAHIDLEDPKQTVYWPEIGTTATDASDGDKYLYSTGEKTVVDEVAYEGLVPGESYTLNGELMDKLTGESTGITASTEFVPEAADGTVNLEFLVPAELQGSVLVAFERITFEDREVAAHTDIEDVDQTVYWPAIGTSAVDRSDGDKILPHTGGTVIDKVAYEGLEVGAEYTVNG